MKRKSAFSFISAFCIILFITSCNTAATSSPLNTSPITSSQPQLTSEPARIMRELHISSLPKLGETSELTFTVNVKELWEGGWEGRLVDDLAQARSWVEFTYADIHGSYTAARKFVSIPLSEVAANDLIWEGNALENRDITLSSNFQILEEGVWKITGYFSANKWEEPLIVRNQYAIADGMAVQMYIPGTGLSDSPLAYLGYINYGMIKDKVPNEETDPVIMQLDISKPPLLGEEANLTCTVTSLYDVPDFSINTLFLKSPGIKTKIPISDFLVEGELQWQGDLKAQTLVTLSAIIKFPEEGEWQIHITGNSPERESAHLAGYFDSIQITITQYRAYYGWKEIIYTSTTPPSVPAATTLPTSTTPIPTTSPLK